MHIETFLSKEDWKISPVFALLSALHDSAANLDNLRDETSLLGMSAERSQQNCHRGAESNSPSPHPQSTQGRGHRKKLLETDWKEGHLGQQGRFVKSRVCCPASVVRPSPLHSSVRDRKERRTKRLLHLCSVEWITSFYPYTMLIFSILIAAQEVLSSRDFSPFVFTVFRFKNKMAFLD